jgi:hypothetical protein
MTNSYTYASNGPGAVTSDDIVSTPGTAHPSFAEDTWRIRGASTGNGWNLSAPEYTQGVEFDVSTLGFQNISVSFDWYSTTQGVRDLQEQYNLNIGNTSTWINIGAPLVATSNDYYGGVAAGPTNTINFFSITGVNNDSSFGVRLVSAYDPAFGNNTYSSAASNNTTQTVYNNSSGNWRFGNITITGTSASIAVPEPATTGILTGAMALLVGAIAAKRRRKSPVVEVTSVPVMQ